MNDTEFMDAVVKGFADAQASIQRVRDELQNLRDELHYFDRKLDNRFDLLERMMQEHRLTDRNEVREIATRVANLEQAN